MKYTLLAASLLFFSFSTVNASDNSLLKRAINGNHRSAEHKSRDQYRHPQETLNFFEVKPDMTVVEIWPGGKGWYTEILAPYLKDKGKLYAAHFSANSDTPYFKKNLKKFKEKTNAQPNIYGKMIISTLQPPKIIDIAPDGSADRVLTFRNIHNWMKNDQAPAVFKAMFNALKPGGILGIVEHRAIQGSDQDPKATSGYVKQCFVIIMAEQAGFEFVDQSEINANPKDTTIYPEGVWTLPPSLRLKEQDKEKYLSIGESDRMTLKFRKP
ncbi:MAG: methyltransferase [Methylococcaceae bacterium]|nr:methyltransferase [Methylococcaceae bacterium]